jgi:hypothetical protein
MSVPTKRGINERALDVERFNGRLVFFGAEARSSHRTHVILPQNVTK